MKINQILYLIIVLFAGLFCSCKKEDQTRLQAGWTSKDPIAIPFNVRNNEKTLGNLVMNPSFETGKIYYEESNVKSYDIAGWKKVGQNIKWIDATSADYSEHDVFEGTHAVKIERANADETETTGEGIISDFIKVIPGNYSLKMQLRLEDVCPNQARIGTKMYDAVNIRLQYFDKNRLPINGNEHDAFSNKDIDNTFKSFTLSNFWHIDKFGWGEVHGKTANYPFFDGDIPDDARYVKIFIGLKGTGKMWIDHVDFRYTDENFTMLERLKPYFDSSYLAYDLVFPQPQQLERKKELQLYNFASSLYPAIVIPENANKNIKQAANRLKGQLINQLKQINDSLLPDISVVTHFDLTEAQHASLVFSIGKSNIYHEYKNELPDSLISNKQDAYYIYQPETENLVFINGTSHEAYKNALHTIEQLLGTKKAIYYSANIIDYPDFLERAYLLHYYNGTGEELNQKLALLNQFKFNNTYFEWYPNNKNNFPFTNYSQLETNKNSLMVDLVKLSTVETVNEDNLLENSGADIFSSQLNSILLVGGYYQEYEGCSADKVSFYSNTNLNKHLQFDHMELLNAFDNYLKKHNLSTSLEFLSPWNRLEIMDRGHGKAEFYYYDLQRNKPQNLAIYWTGGTYYTNSIDYAEFSRMEEITGMPPILMDNSLMKNDYRFKTDYEKNYYAGKIRVLALFEPYQLKTFNGFYQKSNKKKILLNIKELSELNTIRILTAGNYFWNTEDYNPDKSIWIILNKMLGRKNAINLIYFNDAYFGLKEICRKIESNGLQYKNTRIAKNFQTQLNGYFNKLENGLTNKVLLHELETLKSDLLLKYNELTESVK